MVNGRPHAGARPGYYSVPLTRYGVKAEMTATARVGMHRYTFPASEEAALVIDLENGGCWDKTTEAFMQAEGNSRIVGYRYSKGWAKNQRVYFVAEFAKPFDSFELKGKEKMYGRASFTTTEGEEILLKVAISPVSIEGARLAMQTELPGWEFQRVADNALQAWESELSRIKIEGDDELKAKFYTAIIEAYPERMVCTRTWHTNLGHLHILRKLGFTETCCLENDRGEGIHTVYYALPHRV